MVSVKEPNLAGWLPMPSRLKSQLRVTRCELQGAWPLPCPVTDWCPTQGVPYALRFLDRALTPHKPSWKTGTSLVNGRQINFSKMACCFEIFAPLIRLKQDYWKDDNDGMSLTVGPASFATFTKSPLFKQCLIRFQKSWVVDNANITDKKYCTFIHCTGPGRSITVFRSIARDFSCASGCLYT